MPITHQQQLYTFGYGNRTSIDVLLDYCKVHNIDAVIDVRLKPFGWASIWSKPTLSKILPAEGIAYYSYTALGNTSGSPQWEPPSYTESEEALAELVAMAQNKTLLLMCGELNPENCHRTAVAQVLAKRLGFEITHLA